MTTSHSKAQQRQHEQTCRALSQVIADRVSKNRLDFVGAITAMIDVLAAGVSIFALLAKTSEAEQVAMIDHVIVQLREIYKVRLGCTHKPMLAPTIPDKWTTH